MACGGTSKGRSALFDPQTGHWTYPLSERKEHARSRRDAVAYAVAASERRTAETVLGHHFKPPCAVEIESAFNAFGPGAVVLLSWSISAGRSSPTSW